MPYSSPPLIDIPNKNTMNIIRVLLAISSVSLASSAWAEHHKVGASLNEKEEISIEEIPAGVLSAIKEIAPNMTINEAEKEFKHGNTYIDVEGKLEDGREIEFDLLKKGEQWQVVEIQRDLQLEQLPEKVTQALADNSPTFAAKRIIESIQHGQDIIIYEFYGLDSDGIEIRKEVKLQNGIAEVLEREWSH